MGVFEKASCRGRLEGVRKGPGSDGSYVPGGWAEAACELPWGRGTWV